MPIITLITDFGLSDEYVGVMKGVMYTVNPLALVVDITHGIGHQDTVQAAYTLWASYPYFPEGTLHVIVVDPGVGTGRKILAAKINGHFFLAPDNGILDLLMAQDLPDILVSVENRRYFAETVSHTFHGRDIFSPVAAHLSKGLDIRKLGPEIAPEKTTRLAYKKAYVSGEKQISGTVIAIDRFGNLMTDIHRTLLENVFQTKRKMKFAIKAGAVTIAGLSDTFSDVLPNTPVAYIGSRGLLEIAVNCGNAKTMFKVDKHDPVVVCT